MGAHEHDLCRLALLHERKPLPPGALIRRQKAHCKEKELGLSWPADAISGDLHRAFDRMWLGRPVYRAGAGTQSQLLTQRWNADVGAGQVHKRRSIFCVRKNSKLADTDDKLGTIGLIIFNVTKSKSQRMPRVDPGSNEQRCLRAVNVD